MITFFSVLSEHIVTPYSCEQMVMKVRIHKGGWKEIGC